MTTETILFIIAGVLTVLLIAEIIAVVIWFREDRRTGRSAP